MCIKITSTKIFFISTKNLLDTNSDFGPIIKLENFHSPCGRSERRIRCFHMKYKNNNIIVIMYKIDISILPLCLFHLFSFISMYFFSVYPSHDIKLFILDYQILHLFISNSNKFMLDVLGNYCHYFRLYVHSTPTAERFFCFL